MGDLSAIWTMTASDLRQRIRDRSVLMFGLIVPLALMGVFNLLFSDVGSQQEFEPVTVTVNISEQGELAGGLVSTLSSLDEIMDLTLREVDDESAARASVADGDAELAVLVPDDFDHDVQAGGSPRVEVVTTGDGTLEQQVVTAVVGSFVDRVAAGSQAAWTALSTGLSTDDAAEIAAEVGQAPPTVTTSAGEPADEQLSLQGHLVAGQTALFMLFTVAFGVVGYLEEREAGTLTRLLSLPIRPRAVIFAKTLVSFLLGVFATTILLVAGGLLFDVSWGAPLPVALLVLGTVAAATSLVLLVAKVARTAEQAQVTQSILALVLGILGGAFFPIAGSGLLALLSDLSPPGAFIRALGITSAGGGVGDIGGPLLVVAGFTVATVLVWLVLPEREAVA